MVKTFQVSLDSEEYPLVQVFTPDGVMVVSLTVQELLVRAMMMPSPAPDRFTPAPCLPLAIAVAGVWVAPLRQREQAAA